MDVSGASESTHSRINYSSNLITSTRAHGNVRHQDISFKCTSDSINSEARERQQQQQQQQQQQVFTKSLASAAAQHNTMIKREERKRATKIREEEEGQEEEEKEEENVIFNATSTSSTRNVVDSCSSSCGCSCDSCSSFSSSTSCMSTGSSCSVSASSHQCSSSSHTSTVSSCSSSPCDSDSSTISDHECKSENSCLDDQETEVRRVKVKCDADTTYTLPGQVLVASSSPRNSASPSFCSCCCESEQIAMTSEHQLVTCEANIADGEMYDEIEDAFKLLESPCEKGDTHASVKKSVPPPPPSASSSSLSSSTVTSTATDLHTSWQISKSNWLKQSTFTMNGAQAIFYLKLLHESPCDSNQQSTLDTATATVKGNSTSPSLGVSLCEQEITSTRSIDSQRCENERKSTSTNGGGSKFSMWMLKKKSLARVMNRSSRSKSETETGTHCSSSSSQLNAYNKKCETNAPAASVSDAVNDSKGLAVKSEHEGEDSCVIRSNAIAAQVNKSFTSESTRKGDAIKVDGKQWHKSVTDAGVGGRGGSSLHLLTYGGHRSDTRLLESPTLTTQQLLEQYPDICSQSKHGTSSTYQPPRPPKPLRFRPPQTLAQVNSDEMNNRLEEAHIKCNISRPARESISPSESVNNASLSNCTGVGGGGGEGSFKETLHSHSLCYERCNTCESKCTNKSHPLEERKGGVSRCSSKCYTIDHGQCNRCTGSNSSSSYEDTLIKLLKDTANYSKTSGNGASCCTIDCLNERLNSNSLMVLFMTPLSSHTSSLKSSESECSIDLSNSRTTGSHGGSDVPTTSSTQQITSNSISTTIHSTAAAAAGGGPENRGTLKSSPASGTPVSRVSRGPSSPIIADNTSSHCKVTKSNSSNSSVQRDCLAYMYPDSCSCARGDISHDDDNNYAFNEYNSSSVSSPARTCKYNERNNRNNKKKSKCIRNALIAKLKGMFITLCHVTSDITHQLPISCTISLDEREQEEQEEADTELEEGGNKRYSHNSSFDRKHCTSEEEIERMNYETDVPSSLAKRKLNKVKQRKTDKHAHVRREGEEGEEEEEESNYLDQSYSRRQPEKQQEWQDNTLKDGKKTFTRRYKVAFIHEFTSILVVAIPEAIDSEVTSVISLITSLSTMIKFSFASLDSAFKNKCNHSVINSYLNLINCTFLSPITLTRYISPTTNTGVTLTNVSTVLSPILGLVQKLHFTDDEFYTEISDKLSEYETKDWTQFDRLNRVSHNNYIRRKKYTQADSDSRAKEHEEQEEERTFDASIDKKMMMNSSSTPGDFLVVGSILFQKGFLVASHIPLYFQADIINFVTTRGLLDLTSRHSCKLVVWQEVHPTGANKHLIQYNMSHDYIHCNNSSKFGEDITFNEKARNMSCNSGGSGGGIGYESFNDSAAAASASGATNETFNSMRQDTSDYSAHSGRFFILLIAIKHTLFTVLLEVPFIFSTEPIITPNEIIIAQTVRFVVSSLQRSGITDQVNDHLLLQSLAQFSHETNISSHFVRSAEKKSFTAAKLLKSAKSLRDLLSFTSLDNGTSYASERKGNSSSSSNNNNNNNNNRSSLKDRCNYNDPEKERENYKQQTKVSVGVEITSNECVPAHAPVNISSNYTVTGKISSSSDHLKQISSCSKKEKEKEKRSRRKVGSQEQCLKKTQSSPSLNSASAHRQQCGTSNDNLFASRLLLQSSSPSACASASASPSSPPVSSFFTSSFRVSSTSPSSRATARSIMHTNETSQSISTEAMSLSDATFSRNSLFNEYADRLSSLVAQNVLLFTDFNLKEATCTSSILAPLMEEENLSFKLNDLLKYTRKNQCKMNHRLSHLILPQYRQAMIHLHSYLDSMPLVKEAGVSFSLSSSAVDRMMRDHVAFCPSEGRDKMKKEQQIHSHTAGRREDQCNCGERRRRDEIKAMTKTPAAAAATTTVTARTSQLDGESNLRALLSSETYPLEGNLTDEKGSNKKTRQREEVGEQKSSSHRNDERVVQGDLRASSTHTGPLAPPPPPSSSSSSSSCPTCKGHTAYASSNKNDSSSHKHNNSDRSSKSVKDKLIYQNTNDKVIYWVCAYRKSPVQTLFTCSILPKDTNGSKLLTINNNITSGASGSGSGGKSGKQSTFTHISYSNNNNNNNNNSSSSSNNITGPLQVNSHQITKGKQLHCHFVSMQSIAYALSLAEKDC